MLYFLSFIDDLLGIGSGIFTIASWVVKYSSLVIHLAVVFIWKWLLSLFLNVFIFSDSFLYNKIWAAELFSTVAVSLLSVLLLLLQIEFILLVSLITASLGIHATIFLLGLGGSWSIGYGRVSIT